MEDNIAETPELANKAANTIRALVRIAQIADLPDLAKELQGICESVRYVGTGAEESARDLLAVYEEARDIDMFSAIGCSKQLDRSVTLLYRAVAACKSKRAPKAEP